MRRSFAGPRLAGLVLLAASVAILLAVFAIRYLVNQVVLGVVLNTFALGLTNLGYHSIMAGTEKLECEPSLCGSVAPSRIRPHAVSARPHH